MTRDDELAELTLRGPGAAIAGFGALLMAFFPFAIPILLLTLVFLAPLLVIGLVPALLLGGAWLVARGIGRARRMASRAGTAPSSRSGSARRAARA